MARKLSRAQATDCRGRDKDLGPQRDPSRLWPARHGRDASARGSAPWSTPPWNTPIRDLLTGRLPTPVLIRVVLPAAYLSFALGACLAFAALPPRFDYKACVLSRLGSSVHNPDGYLYLTAGLVAMAALLVPVAQWLAGHCQGCARLSCCGRVMMLVGLGATALVGIERAWFPTHWTSMEHIHLALAGVAFASLWLGQAMFAGASGPPGSPRVRWRWLYRPPWYLAICILPIAVVFGMYLPMNTTLGVKARVLSAWPDSLRFLATATFWQWYLTLGLLGSFSIAARRACRQESPRALSLGAWRFDTPQKLPPNQRRLRKRPARTSKRRKGW